MTAATALRYGFKAEVAVGYDEAVARTRVALADEGFSVLTEIDVRATMKLAEEVRDRLRHVLEKVRRGPAAPTMKSEEK